jgi:hypothetical protein
MNVMQFGVKLSRKLTPLPRMFRMMGGRPQMPVIFSKGKINKLCY